MGRTQGGGTTTWHETVWCIVPVAGRGSRLAALTGDRPKALLRVGGRSVIELLLERLVPAVTDVCLVVDDAGGAIRKELGDSKCGLRLHYAVQSRPLGVADAVLETKDLVQGTFAVLMGDCYYDEPLARYFEQWRQSGVAGAVLTEPATGRSGDRKGLVRLRGGRVVEIWKAPFEGQAECRVAGLVILPEDALGVCLRPAARGSAEYEIEDVIAELIRRGTEFLSLRYGGWRRNINTPADLREVEQRIGTGRKD